MEFSRQEYWSGLPFPSPGDLPNPGIKPRSPALQADSFPSEPNFLVSNLFFFFFSSESFLVNLFAWQQRGCRHIKNRLVDTVGEGERGMNWDTSVNTWTLPNVKLDSQWEFAVRRRELKSDAPWQPRGVGWGGRCEGGASGREQMYTCGWFMLPCGRDPRSIVKCLSSN